MNGNLYAEHDAGERFLAKEDVTPDEAKAFVNGPEDGDDPFEGCDMVWESLDKKTRLFWDYDEEEWVDE
jgi:hypothetical protein